MGKTSLRGMLQHSDALGMLSLADFNGIYECICLMPSNVILIFDGLDELKVDDGALAEENIVNSQNEVVHILMIFKQLVKGRLLPGATLLITSRPTAEYIYQDLEYDREVEILGFHEEQIKEYVEKFCLNDKQKSSEIWNVISESPELLSLCYIPVYSYIVCLRLKESIAIEEQQEAEGHSSVPRTITDLYKRAIKILLFRHHFAYKDKPVPKDYIIAKLPEQLQNDLNKLKEIARNGMMEDQLIFEFETNDEFVSELSHCGLFNKLDDKRQHIFCFLHLTIQEFLAALHVVDDMSKVESFMCEHIDNRKWHLVIQFVAGLIGDKIREINKERSRLQRSGELTNSGRTQELARNEIVIESLCQRFQDWMPKTGLIESGNSALLVIKCVHEIQEVRILKLIASFGCEDDVEKVRLGGVTIAPVECNALFTFLGYVKKLHKLKIISCKLEHFGFRELDKLLRKGTEITDLVLELVDITEQSAKHITDTLRDEYCKLTRLDMIANQLTEDSAEYFCDALKSENCVLSKLCISSNGISDECAKYLSDALKSDKCQLVKLDISHNRLSDEGAEYLSDALKSANCKLTKLNISGSGLTKEGARYLSDALKNGNCKLTKLNLNFNKIGDVGAKYLCDALKSKNCNLTELNISANTLRDESAEYLSDALKNENCKLTKLDVSGNRMDEGADYLVDDLESGKCKLTELNVYDQNIY